VLSIEDYIASRKKKDKLDEFDFKKHSENMGVVIQYVMDYFNQYLNLEDYSYEQMKMHQTVDKFKAGLMERYPSTYEFIVSYYWESKKRLDIYVEKAFREMEDCELFYLPEDYRKVAEYVCKDKLNISPSDELLNNISVMAKEYCSTRTEKPSLSGMKEMDNLIIDWVLDVYRNFHINLLEYARDISYSFYDRYIQREYDGSTETHYSINKYDYRYQNNPFNINDIYERNKHREFVSDHKGELEMLIMYYWLFEDVKDPDYWPEYVTLCITNERVNLASQKRILKPVSVSGLDYPSEINTNVKFIETANGIIKENPGANYILCITYDKMNDDAMWKDKDTLDIMLSNLHTSFKVFGAPELLEFISPYSTPGYNEEAFFNKYQLFEKSMRSYSKMKIAIINGYTKSNKGKSYLYSTVEDIVRLRNTCKEMKLQLKLAVDLTDRSGKNSLKSNIQDMVNTLATMRNFIVGLHINDIGSWGRNSYIYENDKRHEYINTMDYPSLSTFIAGLSMVLQDSRTRYFIPNFVKNSDALEILVDTLYRGGCYFESGVTDLEEERN
jgi:hypothetical protein